MLKIRRGQGHKQGDKLRDSCNNMGEGGGWSRMVVGRMVSS